MAGSVVKIYGDGEFWIDGQRKAKLYPDGEIWANGQRAGKIYSDGDIWIDGKSVGRVYENGELWIGGKRVATGIYLLDLLERTNDSSADTRDNFSVSTSGFGNSVSNIGEVIGTGGFGCCVIFVIVLLIVALIYACFALWFSELPQILFGNFITLGKVAMVSVYVCMFIMLYQHCRLATKNGRVMFFKGLLMQSGSFIANIVVFTVLDLIVTAVSYGIPVGAALGELGGLLGGIVGMVAAAAIVAAAPTGVSSIISAICIKKGVKIPVLFRGQVKTVPNVFAKGKAAVGRNVSVSTSAWKRAVTSVKRQKGTGAMIVCIAVSLFAVYLNAVLPFAAVMGSEVIAYIPIEKYLWTPAVAVAVGVMIRNKKFRFSGFWMHWFVQSLVMTIGNYINLSYAEVAGVTGGYFLSVACVTFVVGLLATWATEPFARK